MDLATHPKWHTSISNFIPHYIFFSLGWSKIYFTVPLQSPKSPIKLSSFHQQALLSWTLIFKQKFSPHSYYIWNNRYINFKNKSLFYENWLKNGIVLVSQFFNSDGGALYSYDQFLEKCKVPVPPREYVRAFDAIPSGLHMLYKSSQFTAPTSVSPSDPAETQISQNCFSSPDSGRNSRIRHLFQDSIFFLPSAISSFHIKHKMVQRLVVTKKYFLTKSKKSCTTRLNITFTE